MWHAKKVAYTKKQEQKVEKTGMEIERQAKCESVSGPHLPRKG